jgi:hypothetical protein
LQTDLDLLALDDAHPRVQQLRLRPRHGLRLPFQLTMRGLLWVICRVFGPLAELTYPVIARPMD